MYFPKGQILQLLLIWSIFTQMSSPTELIETTRMSSFIWVTENLHGLVPPT